MKRLTLLIMALSTQFSHGMLFALLVSGVQQSFAMGISFDVDTLGTRRSDTEMYDYTRNAVFDAGSALEDTLAFNTGSTTDYIIQDRGAGHEKCLFLNGGIDPAADHNGIYLLNLDMTAGGAGSSRAVVVEWSFDILGASNDADFNPSNWVVILNYTNNNSNIDVTDSGFATNVTGCILAQSFNFTNAGFWGTSGWTTVSGSYEIPAGEAGSRGAIQIRTHTGGWVTAGQGLYCLDNIKVSAFPVLNDGFPAKNLLKNPGFDARYFNVGGGQIPSYWTKKYGSDSQIQTSMTDVKDGYRSLLLNDTGSGSVGAGSDLIDVVPGFNYTAGAEVKCVNTPSKGYIYLRFYDASGGIISTSKSSVASAWTPVTVTAMAPTNAVKAEVLCYVATGADTGEVYFDNAFLMYADERVANGSWAECQAGTLAAAWKQFDANNPASIQQYEGTNVLTINDASASLAQGAYIILPAYEGVPYKFSADAKRISGSSQMHLYFLDAATNAITDCSYLSVTSTTWSNCSVKAIAPPDTCYAKIMFYCPSMSIGTGVYNNVSFTEDYTPYYVSPTGTGAGTNYSDPASYLSSTLWSDVNIAAKSKPVKVVFRSGDYNTGNLNPGAIGNLRYATVLEGEQPFGTTFTEQYGIRLHGARNTVLRNIHFGPAPAALSTILVVGTTNVETRNITCSDCYFIEMTNLLWSGISISYPGTHQISVNDCIFLRIGRPTDSSHIFYNMHGSYGIRLADNYMEDAWGTYVKTRDASSGYRIVGNTFIQNNGYRTGSSKPFIHFSAYNVDGESRDEILGTDYLIESNYFEYVNFATYPLWIWVEGPTPINHPGYHEIDLSEKQTIENTGNSALVRNVEILENFGIDILNDWVIGNNVYSNASNMKLNFSRQAFSGVSTNVSADLDTLIGAD